MTTVPSIAWTLGIAVVIPSYRVKAHLAEVVAAMGPEVDVIYCVDDGCPEDGGGFIERTEPSSDTSSNAPTPSVTAVSGARRHLSLCAAGR